jgi:Outer membrane protein beta-barrel domain
MKKLLIVLLFPILLNAQEEVESQIINPNGNWYFGAEIGNNTITSFTQGESNKSFQGGLLAEYYTGRHWSLSGRIKYFETGVSFYEAERRSSSVIFNLDFKGFSGQFKGAVISIPIDLKWEYRIFKNLRGNFKIGYAYNLETKSNYKFSENLKTDYYKSFSSINTGLGLNYFINKKSAIYIDFENYSFGGAKGNNQGFFWTTYYYTENNIINIGFKYNFKK